VFGTLWLVDDPWNWGGGLSSTVLLRIKWNFILKGGVLKIVLEKEPLQ